MIHLITGGSGSGKSEYAEKIITSCPGEEFIYLATLFPGRDAENIERIERHRARRADRGFVTIECPRNIAVQEFPDHSNILLEDLSNLVANEMFMPDASGIHAVNAVLDGLSHLAEVSDNLVIVTNEICSDGVAYDNATRVFQEFLGAINQEAARTADCVTEVVYGIPLVIKKPSDG